MIQLFLWVRFKESRPFSSIGFRGRNPIGKLLLGFVIGAAMMTIGVIAPWALGHYVTSGSVHTNVGSAALGALIPLVIVFLLQASTEEAVFRGYLLQVTGSQTNALIAIIGTSVFFAVIHTDFRPIVLTNITLYAVFACFVALGQGNLWLIADCTRAGTTSRATSMDSPSAVTLRPPPCSRSAPRPDPVT